MVHAGSAFEAYKHLARSLYGFRDYRENATSSLNETLENMVAFAMDDEYSGWIADLRAFDYNTDVKGTVKVVSALHPLSLALLTDNPEIFRRRALPMIEYLMSRERFLFAKDPEQKGQNASHFMKGPAAPISQLAGLFAFSGGRSEVFKHHAEALLEKPRALNLDVMSKAASWQSLLAMYRMTGEAKYLERAKAGADQYLAERVAAPQADFRKITPGEGFEFWVDYTPNWFDLLNVRGNAGATLSGRRSQRRPALRQLRVAAAAHSADQCHRQSGRQGVLWRFRSAAYRRLSSDRGA